MSKSRSDRQRIESPITKSIRILWISVNLEVVLLPIQALVVLTYYQTISEVLIVQTMRTDTKSCILQWNCQEMRSKKEEVIQLVNLHKSIALALQETKFWRNKIVNIAGYTLYNLNGHFNVTAHCGVALYIHRSTPAQELTLETPY